MIGKTLDGVITSWNSGAERMYGYTAAEIVGRNVSVLIPSERSDELPAILKRLANGERVEHYETAAYSAVSEFARVLGQTKHASLLEKTLAEETQTDQKLAGLAKTINSQANEEGSEEDCEEDAGACTWASAPDAGAPEARGSKLPPTASSRVTRATAWPVRMSTMDWRAVSTCVSALSTDR